MANGSGRWSRLGRVLRFAAGLFVGMAAVPILGALGMAGLLGISLVAERMSPPNQVREPRIWTVGSDISRAGGATILVRGRRNAEATRQTCREACDDLIYRHSTLEHIEVRDAKGRCIVCRDTGRALPFQKPKRWSLGGRPLELTEEGAR